MAVHYIGVRHHSPACARVVADAIERVQPAWVLVEGPADMNERLDELLLGHDLPVALYSYVHGEGVHHGSWTPFCEYSPEWQALTVGTKVGARVRFIDLPAWHWAFGGRENRFSDSEERYQRAVAQLSEHFRVDGLDALWDHLFEQTEPVAETAERLAVYFDGLRGADDEVADFDRAREQHMAQWVAAAHAKEGDAGGDIVVVTGGFHTAAIRAHAEESSTTTFPDVPQAEGAVRTGSYLVPFTYKRLDAFVGYQSGMPSPAWYKLAWQIGNERAGDVMLDRIATALRDKNQPVSAADLIAARTTGQGLASLRGHRTIMRTDLLDGLASALIKDAQDVRLPWTQRGPLRAGTDPMVVEITRMMSGTKRGQLHTATPLPPLIADVTAKLEHPRLFGSSAERSLGVELDLLVEADLEASRILHQLRVLSIPGVDRIGGSSLVGGVELNESWALNRPNDQLPALIEASAFGATLRTASAAKLAAALADAAGDPEALAQVLGQAVLIGIASLTSDVVDAVQTSVRACHDIRPLGRLLSVASSLHRYDSVLESAGDETLAHIITTTFDRAVWLLETVTGNDEPHRVTHAIVAMRDAMRCDLDPPLDATAVAQVLHRVSVDDKVGHEIRGAAFGFGWVLATGASATEMRSRATRAFAKSNRVDTLGDWLAGLFALARDLVVNDDVDDDQASSLVALIDGAICAMSDDDFLIALPSLRMAFTWFPPSERESLAERILARHGVVVTGHALPKLSTDPQVIARGHAIDSRVDETLGRYGLGGVQ